MTYLVRSPSPLCLTPARPEGGIPNKPGGRKEGKKTKTLRKKEYTDISDMVDNTKESLVLDLRIARG